MYLKVDGKEKLKYYYFMSLHLCVKKQGRYPKSLPEFHNYVDPADLDQCIGVLQCKVLPPRDLNHPVLSRTFIQGEGQIDLFMHCAQPLRSRSIDRTRGGQFGLV